MDYFIDSNIFLRVAVKTDKKAFQECSSFFSLVKNNTINAACSSLILSEVVWVLGSTYKLPKERVAEAVRAILSFKDIKWVEDYDQRLALEFYKSNSVKFIDAMIASMPKIQSREWTIVSYDKDFDKLKVIRKLPAKIA